MPRKLPNVLTQEQAEKLLAQPNVRCPTGLRNRVMLELMYRAGLRNSEVRNLALADIRWKERELLVRQGKGKKDRTVPITNSTHDWLQRWKDQRLKLGIRSRKHFFTTLKGGQVAERYLQELVKRLAVKAGIEPDRVTPHVLRHTYATQLHRNGQSIRAIQELLGHSSVSTTQVYTHVAPEDLRAAVETLEEAEPEPQNEVAQLAQALSALPAEQRERLSRLLAGG